MLLLPRELLLILLLEANGCCWLHLELDRASAAAAAATATATAAAAAVVVVVFVFLNNHFVQSRYLY